MQKDHVTLHSRHTPFSNASMTLFQKNRDPNLFRPDPQLYFSGSKFISFPSETIRNSQNKAQLCDFCHQIARNYLNFQRMKRLNLKIFIKSLHLVETTKNMVKYARNSIESSM